MSDSLPDTGGSYADADRGGVVGIARRNVGAARAEVASGDAGSQAVAVAIGLAAIPAGRWAADRAGFL